MNNCPGSVVACSHHTQQHRNSGCVSLILQCNISAIPIATMTGTTPTVDAGSMHLSTKHTVRSPAAMWQPAVEFQQTCAELV